MSDLTPAYDPGLRFFRGPQFLHLGYAHGSRLPAPVGAQEVGQVGYLLVTQPRREARHRLHAFLRAEVLGFNAVQRDSDQVVRVGAAHRGIAFHRHRDVRLAAAIESVTAGADGDVGAVARV